MDFKIDDYKYSKFNSNKKQLDELSKLINNKVSETEIHSFIDKNREIFSFALHAHRTGHHGTIVLSKQNIKPYIELTKENGLIPDFIIGGDSSDGFEWWVIELKGIDEKVFTTDKGNKTYFTSVVHKGIFQLIEYLDYCSENQNYLRDTLKLPDFREPNGLIIVGKEDEFDTDKKRKKLKQSWNRLHPKKLEIRTYDWLLRNFRENDKALNFKDNEKSPDWE